MISNLVEGSYGQGSSAGASNVDRGEAPAAKAVVTEAVSLEDDDDREDAEETNADECDDYSASSAMEAMGEEISKDGDGRKEEKGEPLKNVTTKVPDGSEDENKSKKRKAEEAMEEDFEEISFEEISFEEISFEEISEDGDRIEEEKGEPQKKTEDVTTNRNDHDNALNKDEKSSLIVKGLPYRTNEREVMKLFNGYGKIGQVTRPKHPYYRNSQGFAFVDFTKKSDAVRACKAVDGSMFDGRQLNVQMAKPWGMLTRDREPRRSPSATTRRSPTRETRGSPSQEERRSQETSSRMDLKVNGLTYLSTERDVEKLFSRYGKILNICMPKHKFTGNSRGFAFVK